MRLFHFWVYRTPWQDRQSIVSNLLFSRIILLAIQPERCHSMFVNSRSAGQESSFIWDSLAVLSYNGTPVGSFAGAVTDSDSVVVSISPQLISKWFSNAKNVLPTYGLLLKPNRPAAPGQAIRGFESFQGTRIPYIRIIATQNSQIDTFTLSTGYDTYVVNGSPVVDPLKSIYIQPTLGYNALLTFNVSKLPGMPLSIKQ